jgi:hypothetical protein
MRASRQRCGLVAATPGLAVWRCCRRPADLPLFTLELSFGDGEFDALLNDSEHPVARCIVRQMTPMLWPAPPFDDFAEQMHFDPADRRHQGGPPVGNLRSTG